MEVVGEIGAAGVVVQPGVVQVDELDLVSGGGEGRDPLRDACVVLEPVDGRLAADSDDRGHVHLRRRRRGEDRFDQLGQIVGGREGRGSGAKVDGPDVQQDNVGAAVEPSAFGDAGGDPVDGVARPALVVAIEIARLRVGPAADEIHRRRRFAGQQIPKFPTIAALIGGPLARRNRIAQGHDRRLGHGRRGDQQRRRRDDPPSTADTHGTTPRTSGLHLRTRFLRIRRRRHVQ